MMNDKPEISPSLSKDAPDTLENTKKALACMAGAGLPLSGVTAFKDISDGLLQSRALQRLPEQPRSVLITAVSYYTGELHGNVARYAALRDYHRIVGELLNTAKLQLLEQFPGYIFEAFADNSPIPEVRAAVLAGLGFRGKNGLLITEEYGSYVVIGELVTDLPLAATPPASLPGCGGCSLCRQACPSPGALDDKRRCVSGLTQKKGALSPEEKALIKKAGYIYGCDHCQTVCPRNRGGRPTWVKDFYEGIIPLVDTDTSLEDRAFAWRGRKTLLRNLEILAEEQSSDPRGD